MLERRRQLAWPQGSVGRKALAYRAQDLREDHARVPPGPLERGSRDRGSEFVRLHSLGRQGGQRRHDGFLRHQQVGARITIGNRVDVQGVDLFSMAPKLLGEDLQGSPEGRQVEGARHQNRW